MTKREREILREYLQICSRIWRWIGKNITVESIEMAKGNWPEWEENGGTVPSMTSDCPCCEFVRKFRKDVCPPCLINWAGGDCLDYKSEYFRACDASTQRTKRYWANRVAKLAEEALARLEDES